MKRILIVLFLVCFSGNAYALNLGELLNDVEKGANQNLDKKVDKIIQKIEKKIDGKVEKYEAKIKEVEVMIDEVNHIRANASSYIRTAKIVLAVLSSGILALIFVMWRIWRNIVTMRKIIKNVANYDDIEKRLKALEKKVGA